MPAEIPPAVGAGAIHDIGYRSYDGARHDRRRVFATLVFYGLRGAYGLGRSTKSKIAPLLLLAAATLPAIIVVVVASVTGGLISVSYVQYLTTGVQVLLFIWVALAAPFLISRDLRHSLTSLYFSRPLDRFGYVLARYTSATLAILIFMLAPLLLLFFGALLIGQPLGHEVAEFSRAVVFALLQALLLAAIGLTVAVLAPRRGMGIAAIIATLLILAVISGVVGEVLAHSGHDSGQLYASVIAPTRLVGGIGSGMLGVEIIGDDGPQALVEKIVFIGAYLGWLGACAGILALRFRRESVL